jgi:hypothetical protein
MARASDPQDAMAELIQAQGIRISDLEAENADRQAEYQDAMRLFNELQRIVGELVGEQQRKRGYTPTTPPRFWELTGEAREERIAVIRDWVEKVYRPCYPQFAHDLGPCWAEHPLCLFFLDWLSELHKVLYLRDDRTAGQLTTAAEWHIRFLPAARELMRVTTHSCNHAQERDAGDFTANGYNLAPPNGYGGDAG